MTTADILSELRAGPLKLHDRPDRESLAVQIHRLRERGYGIRLVRSYELMYEPDS